MRLFGYLKRIRFCHSVVSRRRTIPVHIKGSQEIKILYISQFHCPGIIYFLPILISHLLEWDI